MFKKQILFCFILFILSPFSYANNVKEECPTIDEIKAGKLNAWVPLYIDNEELASDADVSLFAKNVDYFEVARWNPSYLEAGHCFYHGRHGVINKITFARDAWQPEFAGKWIWVTQDKLAECYSQNVGDCAFLM